jgi:hypothetical protein
LTGIQIFWDVMLVVWRAAQDEDTTFFKNFDTPSRL